MGNRGAALAVGERVEAARRAARYTQQELAEKSGLAYNTFRRRVAQPQQFTVDELNYIAEVLGVSFEWLASGVEVAA